MCRSAKCPNREPERTRACPRSGASCRCGRVQTREGGGGSSQRRALVTVHSGVPSPCPVQGALSPRENLHLAVPGSRPHASWPWSLPRVSFTGSPGDGRPVPPSPRHRDGLAPSAPSAVSPQSPTGREGKQDAEAGVWAPAPRLPQSPGCFFKLYFFRLKSLLDVLE